MLDFVLVRFDDPKATRQQLERVYTSDYVGRIFAVAPDKGSAVRTRSGSDPMTGVENLGVVAFVHAKPWDLEAIHGCSDHS